MKYVVFKRMDSWDTQTLDSTGKWIQHRDFKVTSIRQVEWKGKRTCLYDKCILFLKEKFRETYRERVCRERPLVYISRNNSEKNKKLPRRRSRSQKGENFILGYRRVCQPLPV